MNADLADKCVLITGASGGIGLAAARALADEGANLGLHYRTNARSVDELRGRLDVSTVALEADLRDEQQTDAMFAGAVGEFGRIDAIVVNAGIWRADPVPIHQMTTAQWQETMNANLNSAFLTCRAFLRHLSDQPREAASIVLIGSTAALFGEADHADYAASKAALVYGLTLSLKNEIVRLAPRGRVNAICPGWTDTPMAAKYTDDQNALNQAMATMSLQKIATPEDVARTIVFLSSAKLAGHITGAILPISGGMEGRLLHPCT